MINILQNLKSKLFTRTGLHASLLVALILGNSYFQALCIPTPWAMIVLVICFSAIVLFPLTIHPTVQRALAFINGVSLMVFLYMILFLEQMNYLAVPFAFMGIGLLVFIPHFFAAQLVVHYFIKSKHRSLRLYFTSGIVASTLLIIYASILFTEAKIDLKEAQANGFNDVEQSFMNEKILGMHFIYHTRFCEYDGWRPPKHDPLLVLGMWLNEGKDPLHLSLEDRIAAYKKVFPGKPIKFDCSCAIQYSSSYHNHPLWNQ